MGSHQPVQVQSPDCLYLKLDSLEDGYPFQARFPQRVRLVDFLYSSQLPS